MSMMMDYPVRTIKLLNSDMSDKCATLLSALYRLTDEGTKCTNVSNDYLSWMCKCCERTTIRKLKEAVKLGFIKYVTKKPTRILSLTEEGIEVCRV